MRLSTEGIVLRTMPLGEADLIVTYITREHGVRKAFAKSPRKIGSRFGASLEPFTEARVTFMGKEDAELPRLTQSDIIASHQALRESLKCFVLVSGMAEATLALLPERTDNHEVYDLFSAMLRRMESGCTEEAALVYTIKLLQMKGYAPRLAGCGRCGAEALAFHVASGAVMCGRCSPVRVEEPVIHVSAGAARLYETLRTWDLDKTGRVKAGAAFLKDLNAVLLAHMEHITSRQMRAGRFPARGAAC